MFSKLNPNETRYRLRIGEKIVGYAREIGRTRYYSKDQYWWNGAMIKHHQVDECIGLKDINNIPLFEFDIIEYAIEGKRDRMGCILWEHKKEQFIVKDLDDISLDIPFSVDGLVLFAPEDIKFRAYLFAQPDLMHALGVRDN
ncbi:MAG: hypothetical protein VXY91_04130 [Bacteroidota bacterium]|nr:hypothetical protein [Bacteroidota bacterium]